MGLLSNLFKSKSQVKKVNIQPETGKSHIMVCKVAGVTFDNRQKNLKKLLDTKKSGKMLNIAMKQYEYEGKPAIDIVVNNLNIGNLHTEDVDFVLNHQDRVLGINDLYINTFVNEENKTIFYAKIKLIIANKN